MYFRVASHILRSMKNLSEKRTESRKSLTQSVSFELSTMESGGLSNIVKRGFGVDLSAGGMGMTTRYPLKGGEVVKLLFPVTEGEMLNLPVFTEVMWAVPSGAEYRAGLRFLK
ncbi:MAG: hypothetical protein A2075_22005 [Geobacteraceae bacterium GWC2_58_44]|nr:MAG: hypothetical protein A2075_22005 [Geobacteraceae bacterium GWC2_58_44]